MPRPRISVIMPVAPGSSPASARRAVRRALPGAELILVRGGHPARQRNLAAARAGVEYLYFLDHDACPTPAAPRLLVAALRDPGVAAAGGPNPGRGVSRGFAAAAEAVLGSPLGSPLVWPRYAPGRSGDVSEKSLILCNLVVRREAFLALGGFDPRLYPNEENEFLNRLRAAGFRCAYVPRAAATKPRAPTWSRFVRESFRYARGRMQQIWVGGAPGDAVFVAVLAAAGAAAWAVARVPGGPWLAAAYAAACLAEGARIARGRPWRAFLLAVVLASRHAAYGLGLGWGALTGWRARRLTLEPHRFAMEATHA